jgi:hypothetical protein
MNFHITPNSKTELIFPLQSPWPRWLLRSFLHHLDEHQRLNWEMVEAFGLEYMESEDKGRLREY